jgi:hypothetical protein
MGILWQIVFEARDSEMLKWTLAFLALVPADALQASFALRPARTQSRSAVSMSDVKGPKDWKYVKSINDYGKEQTYMFLGAKEGATDWEEFGGVNPVAAALGIDGVSCARIIKTAPLLTGVFCARISRRACRVSLRRPPSSSLSRRTSSLSSPRSCCALRTCCQLSSPGCELNRL